MTTNDLTKELIRVNDYYYPNSPPKLYVLIGGLLYVDIESLRRVCISGGVDCTLNSNELILSNPRLKFTSRKLANNTFICTLNSANSGIYPDDFANIIKLILGSELIGVGSYFEYRYNLGKDCILHTQFNEEYYRFYKSSPSTINRTLSMNIELLHARNTIDELIRVQSHTQSHTQSRDEKILYYQLDNLQAQNKSLLMYCQLLYTREINEFLSKSKLPVSCKKIIFTYITKLPIISQTELDIILFTIVKKN